MDVIQSKDNSLVKHIKKLKDRKFRSTSGQFLIEGVRFVEEAFKAGCEVPYVLISEHYSHPFIASLMDEDHRKSTKTVMLKEQIFNSLCGTETPQGIMAVVEIRSRRIEQIDGFYILVDRIQDPGNLGTIIRTAHAGGALGILCTKGTVDVYNEKTLRSTMGSIFYMPVIEDFGLKETMNLRQRGFKAIVSSLDTDKDFFQVDLTGNIIICIGNEGNGISGEIAALADTLVKIPMPGGAESLNAAVAGSVMIYESVRQRLTK